MRRLSRWVFIILAGFALAAQAGVRAQGPARDKVAISHLQPEGAAAGDGLHDEAAYLPDVAGPGSVIVATFEDPQQNGSAQAMVGFEDASGRRTFFKATADTGHKLAF